MKKIYFLLFSIFYLGIAMTNAQYTVLSNFDGTNGALPWGSLAQIGKKLYGMAGGGSGYGVIFSVDTTGSSFNDIYVANNAIDCSAEYNGLITIGYKFYGMTENGGVNGVGNIFSIDTNGNEYRDLFDFGYNGDNPFGKLTLHGNILYGMTYDGVPPYQYGNIFSIDTDGSNFRVLLYFNDTNGSEPRGDLTLIGNKLYGMTSMGGANTEGVIFSIDTDGNNYSDLHDFRASNGQRPYGSLTLSGKVLYGMTAAGGAYGPGVIFSIDTDGSNYRDLLDFDGTNGIEPNGSLTYATGKLFGIAWEGGANDLGCIFYIDTNGNGYKDLYDFNGTDGKLPYGNLTLSGSVLYGMTYEGGTIGDGVVFKLDTTNIASSLNQVSAGNNQLLVYPNPNNGIFTLALSHPELVSGTQTIEIYNVLGGKIYTEAIQPQTPKGALSVINLTEQPNGVYFYRVISESGGLFGEGKIIFEK